MISSPILQSLVQVNADNIMRVQAFYQGYRDIQKSLYHMFGTDSEYKRYRKLADKELRKLHLLERNQRELLDELAFAYQHEDFVRLTTEEDYLRYEQSEWD
jgi:hypothetical protein